MDPIVLLPSLLLAGILIAGYLFSCHRRGKDAELTSVVSTVTNSFGIVGSVFLIASIAYPPIKTRIGGLEIYTILGGVAIFFVATKGLKRDIFS